MKRLFIDIIIRSGERQLDLTGSYFDQPEKAREAAEALTIDLAVSDHSPWIGAEVQVMDEAGQCLFTEHVRPLH